jgi:spermidine/putrescine transport system ATP-binding protein
MNARAEASSIAITAAGPAVTGSTQKVAVAVDRVTMVYPGGGQPALDGVSLNIHENEFFTLLGPSGCGKTTLLRLIAGFEQPTAGELSLGGVSLVGKMPFERPVNTVFQSYALFPHMTVAQNIGFGLEMKKVPAAERLATAERMLQLVRLDGMAERRPHQLSGGQQQRVALARALANQPQVLLLDESLSALDLQLRKEMQIELKRLQRETGITFVFVTHDQEEALTMSDRIAVMQGGRVQQVGTPQDIYDRPCNRFVAGFIGEMNLWHAVARDGMADLGPTGHLALPEANFAVPANGSALTLAVRPERLRLAPTGNVKGGLSGQIVDRLYLGNDTTYLVQLAGQALCRVRMQNDNADDLDWQPGDAVCVQAAPGSLHRLTD